MFTNCYYNAHSEDGRKTCVNQYDIRLRDTYPACGMNWPNELKNISSYLRVNKETIYNSYIFVRWQELTQRFSSAYIQRQDVISAINAHAKQEGWVECSGAVGTALDNDPSPPSVTVSVGHCYNFALT